MIDELDKIAPETDASGPDLNAKLRDDLDIASMDVLKGLFLNRR